MPGSVPAATAKPGETVNMKDEITQLADAAEALARVCRDEEYGLASWWMVLGHCMARVAKHSGGGLIYTGDSR